MSGLGALPVLFGVGLLGLGVAYATARALAVTGPARSVDQFLPGGEPVEHAFSRFHVRWYTLAMIYLAFEMEMLFMYPWTLVVSTVGVRAVVEMFVFLGILLVGVLHAWREGALRWV
ncbi:NADH-quinone oxidoreductase subunit A [Actinopolyspora mortivallis]|uniref:NADH-quinone oxidoreductase subunit n=1 Tax=Actinopolyspora mortivallis TaxID=33906 RepID=A0A2T0GS64_ACTMO|nr:NADH-quinone oxidoreductase subunit A [Actinopolyspora mortivallis]PRW61956.1 NADH-quinone oxidoreductase subunit I [Actinopolyspora mortivallis]